jgi:hypothetical protein
MIRRFRFILAAFFFTVLGSGLARSEEPVALVEEVSPSVSHVSAFDYLRTGKQIDLGAKGQITLAYLRACSEEEIKGGRLIVGVEYSTIVGGRLFRRKVTCPLAAQPAAEDSSQSGSMVFRGEGELQTIGTIYPVIVLPAPGQVAIRTPDGKEPPFVINARGLVIDLAAQGHAFQPDRTYKIEYAGRSMMVHVAPDAAANARPLARLILF